MWGRLQPAAGLLPACRSVHTSLSSGTEVPRRLKPAPHLRPCAVRKCEVILARTLSRLGECTSWSRLSAGNDGLRAGVSYSGETLIIRNPEAGHSRLASYAAGGS